MLAGCHGATQSVCEQPRWLGKRDRYWASRNGEEEDNGGGNRGAFLGAQHGSVAGRTAKQYYLFEERISAIDL